MLGTSISKQIVEGVVVAVIPYVFPRLGPGVVHKKTVEEIYISQCEDDKKRYQHVQCAMMPTNIQLDTRIEEDFMVE